MRRLAVFGGTFDPVHRGHLGPALAALATFAFEEVVFVPAGNPPHKLVEPRTPFVHRFAMLALATQDHDRLTVSDCELERAPSYTVDTLRLFRGRRPDADLFFMMGSDSFAQVSTWNRWEELLDLAHLVVLRRPGVWGEAMMEEVPQTLRERSRWVSDGATPLSVEERVHAVFLFDCEPHPASATAVRAHVRGGAPIDDLVTPAVGRYIRKHHLYKDGREGGDGR